MKSASSAVERQAPTIETGRAAKRRHALRTAHRPALPAGQAKAGVHLAHLAHLDAWRRGGRHGARHRAGADDGPAGRAARPHPRVARRTSTSGSRAASPTTTPRPRSLRALPRVAGAAPAILGKGCSRARAGGDAFIQLQGHRPGARGAASPTSRRSMAQGQVADLTPRDSEDAPARDPPRHRPGRAARRRGRRRRDAADAARARCRRWASFRGRGGLRVVGIFKLGLYEFDSSLRLRLARVGRARCSTRPGRTSSSCASTTSTRRRRSPTRIPRAARRRSTSRRTGPT